MPRTTRSRSRTVSLTGQYVLSTNGVPGAPVVRTDTLSSSCTDSYGRPVVNSPFNSSQFRKTLVANGGAAAKGFIGNQVVDIAFNGYPLAVSLVSVSTGPLATPGSWYLDTVARTNPSRPTVTLPTLIQDIFELPSMLRDVGRLIRTPKKLLSLKDLANRNLAVSFGWLPLIADINQLLRLQATVLKRRAELNRLYSGKGLRRKIDFASDVQFGKATQVLAVGKGSVNLSTSIRVDRHVWSTIRWRPETLFPNVPSDYEMHRLARRLVLGLTPEGLAKGLWDVLPWTWLVGWFTSLGNYLLASSNTVPAVHSDACIMNEILITVVPSDVIPTNCIWCNVATSGSYIQSTKTRNVSGTLTPGFALPFIGSFRLSILGSLFIQRFAR